MEFFASCTLFIIGVVLIKTARNAPNPRIFESLFKK